MFFSHEQTDHDGADESGPKSGYYLPLLERVEGEAKRGLTRGFNPERPQIAGLGAALIERLVMEQPQDGFFFPELQEVIRENGLSELYPVLVKLAEITHFHAGIENIRVKIRDLEFGDTVCLDSDDIAQISACLLMDALSTCEENRIDPDAMLLGLGIGPDGSWLGICLYDEAVYSGCDSRAEAILTNRKRQWQILHDNMDTRCNALSGRARRRATTQLAA